MVFRWEAIQVKTRRRINRKRIENLQRQFADYRIAYKGYPDGVRRELGSLLVLRKGAAK